MTGGTRHDHRHAADICRENGWGVGTRLIADAGFGPTVIDRAIEVDIEDHDKEKNRSLTESMFVKLIQDTRAKNGR